MVKLSLIKHRCGKVLIQLLDDYKSADIKVSETLLKIKVVWHKTETQVQFLQGIWDSLDANFQVHQILLLSTLEQKLNGATGLLNSIIGTESAPDGLSSLLEKRGGVRKNKYVLRVKDSLDRALSELLEWYNLFDPSWFLLSRATSSNVDRALELDSKEEPLHLLNALRKSVRDLTSDANKPARPISSRDFLGPRSPIMCSPVATAQFDGRIQQGVVDTMHVNLTMDLAGTTRSIMTLAKVLSRMDPGTFGLLRCCGVINKFDKYEFVFEIPQGLEAPRSLRDLLNHAAPSLNIKLDIAKQLANSVFYLHTAGFVHKNIRPETILVFDRGGHKSSFLFGFENFRAVTGETVKTGDGLPERELYRHPFRQGNNPERRYVMQHDIYSLGVCLLEIGIWRSFVHIDSDTKSIEFEPQDTINDSRRKAFTIKQQLLVAANVQLAQHMGEKFKNIVEGCLTCLDEDMTWTQADDQRGQDISIGIEFIENVLLQLQEIVV